MELYYFGSPVSRCSCHVVMGGLPWTASMLTGSECSSASDCEYGLIDADRAARMEWHWRCQRVSLIQWLSPGGVRCGPGLDGLDEACSCEGGAGARRRHGGSVGRLFRRMEQLLVNWHSRSCACEKRDLDQPSLPSTLTQIVMALLVRAGLGRTVLVQVARTRRAMTLKRCFRRSIAKTVGIRAPSNQIEPAQIQPLSLRAKGSNLHQGRIEIASLRSK
jgi:hypothetical protein